MHAMELILKHGGIGVTTAAALCSLLLLMYNNFEQSNCELPTLLADTSPISPGTLFIIPGTEACRKPSRECVWRKVREIKKPQRLRLRQVPVFYE